MVMVLVVCILTVGMLIVFLVGWGILWFRKRETELTQQQLILTHAFPTRTLQTEITSLYHPHLRDRMHPYNPSLFVYQDQKYLVHRLSTFNMCKDIIRHFPEFIAVKERHGVLNSIVIQTPRGNCIFVDVPHDNPFPCPEAYVDPRSIVWKNDLVLVVNNPQHEKCKKTTMVLLFLRLGHVEDLECTSLLTPYRVLDLSYADARPIEKNWMPFVYHDQIHFVYSVSPHVILRCDTETGVCTRIAGTETKHEGLCSLRGGSPFVYVPGRGYLTVAHIRHVIGGMKLVYHSVLYLMESEPPFRILTFSPPFFLDDDFEPHRFKQIIQFAAGLWIQGDHLLISYGSGDCSSRVLSLPLDDALCLLHPV